MVKTKKVVGRLRDHLLGPQTSSLLRSALRAIPSCLGPGNKSLVSLLHAFHVLQKLPGASVEVFFTAAAAQRGAHLVSDRARVAGLLQRPEEGGVVDDAFAHGHGPDGLGLARVVDERPLVAVSRPAGV